jgi:hypothetical protein
MRIGKIQGIGELFTVKIKEKADKPKTELWSLKRKLWVLGKKRDRCRYWRRVKIEEDFVVDRNRERERERERGGNSCCLLMKSRRLNSEVWRSLPPAVVNEDWRTSDVELWTVECGQMACRYWSGGNIYYTIAVQYMFLLKS